MCHCQDRWVRIVKNLRFSKLSVKISPIKCDVTGSYFELLTEQEGIPAKPFDPVGELKCLRRRLALRMHTAEPLEIKMQNVVPIPQTESISLETVVKKVGDVKKMLLLWQRSRCRRRSPRTNMFRGNRQYRKRQIPSVVSQYFTAPQEGTLETINAGLTALGIVGVTFGVLSFFRGWESDLSLGFLVSLSGLAVIAIGLGGRLLASRSDCS